MYDDRKRDWLLITAAALAGGQSAKQAVESANAITRTAEERFPDRERDDDRD